jgi:hypothetical protein
MPLLVPITVLEKGRLSKLEAAGQVGMDFDEEDHPRAPKGDTQHHGGEFVQKEEAPHPAEVAAAQDDQLAKPWTITPDRYQHLIGVKQPWLAEISPMQYGLLGKRQKEAYDKKRAAEWEASGAAKDEWRGKVISAWDAGIIDSHSPELHPEAKTAITMEKIHRGKAAKEANLQAAQRTNEITSVDQVEVGDRVFDLMSGKYGKVTKKNKTSVVFEQEAGGYNPGPRKVDARGLRWKSYTDLQAEAGITKSLRLVVPKEVREAPETQTGLADFLGEAPDAILDPESKPPAKPRVHRRYPERRHSQGGRAKLIVPIDPK